jgi:molybdenum cofactor guanylyltransferase
MGFDKASVLIDGVPCAVRVATVMRGVVTQAVEVGPGISGLPAVEERPPGSGPLVALCAGARALRASGHALPALVVACDLPLLTEAVLRALARSPGTHSVVPVVDGRLQPLCARWSATDLLAASDLVAAGQRSMHALCDRPGVQVLDEGPWSGTTDCRALSDVDTPADLERLGLTWSQP